ncbi:hypothetical protein BV20DRAFT_215785 [Pilatotrama ljubarskyi]|nr:hypothetical protein BV20DRAFT_215785 [Pilatotrama ljubarskyi]
MHVRLRPTGLSLVLCRHLCLRLPFISSCTYSTVPFSRPAYARMPSAVNGPLPELTPCPNPPCSSALCQLPVLALTLLKYPCILRLTPKLLSTCFMTIANSHTIARAHSPSFSAGLAKRTACRALPRMARAQGQRAPQGACLPLLYNGPLPPRPFCFFSLKASALGRARVLRFARALSQSLAFSSLSVDLSRRFAATRPHSL